MDNLINIINKDGNLLVSSREVAENFEKEHKNVIRDIESYIKTLKNGESSKLSSLFIENEYTTKDANGVKYKEYLLNRDGFTLLAMGFTGKKALEWKLKYIEAFNKMERALTQVKKLSPIEQLKLQYEVLDEHEERLKTLENNMTVDFGQQRRLQNKAKSKAVTILGGMKSHAYKDSSMRSKVFSAIWRDYKDYFMVSSYRDTSRVDFDKAMEYLDNWQVQGRLLREIEECNKQIGIEEVM